MEIRKTIQYTQGDLQLGYSLHLKKMNPFRSLILPLLGIFFMIIGTWLVVLQSLTGAINWMSWGFFLYGLLILLFYRWKFRSMGKTAYKKLTNFHHPFEFTFTEEKVVTVGKNSTSESKWEHYQMAVVTNKIILLYPNKLTFVILPRSYFTEEEYSLLTKWVKEKVKCR